MENGLKWRKSEGLETNHDVARSYQKGRFKKYQMELIEQDWQMSRSSLRHPWVRAQFHIIYIHTLFFFYFGLLRVSVETLYVKAMIFDNNYLKSRKNGDLVLVISSSQTLAQ